MVTDNSVDALTASTRERMREEVKELFDKARDRNLDPRGYEVQLFQPNAARTRVVPAYDRAKWDRWRGWSISPRAPQAVTGSAWVANEYYFLQNSELSKSELRLTSEHQERYRDLTGVAATPVKDASGQVIAVLTIFSKRKDPEMDTDDFVNTHVGLADEVGHILRAYIGPPAFETVTVKQAGARTLPGGRIDVTPQVVAEARESKAFEGPRQELDLPSDPREER